MHAPHVSPSSVLYFNVYVNILIIWGCLFCFVLFCFFAFSPRRADTTGTLCKDSFGVIFFFFFGCFLGFIFGSARFNLFSCKYCGAGLPPDFWQASCYVDKIDFTA